MSKRILIVDDDASLLVAMSTRLGAAGYEVTQAQDAVQAVRFAREQRPDLLVLDVNLPAGDGFTVLERIREIPEMDQTPVIYITGDRSVGVSAGVAEVGAIAILYKPFETAQLLESVAHASGGDGVETIRALDSLQAAADAYIRLRAS